MASTKKFRLGGVQRWINEKCAKGGPLRKTKCKKLAGKRTGDGVMQNVVSWIGQLKEELSQRSFSADCVFNYDETRIHSKNGDQLVLERIEAADRERSNMLFVRDKSICSYIPFVSASGKVLVSFYILPAHFREEGDSDSPDEAVAEFVIRKSHLHPRRGSWERFFVFTKSGCINSNAFAMMVSKFIEIWTLHHPGLNCILFGDQLSAHSNIDVVEEAFDHNILMWLLPANTSHFLQPLDERPFGIFKKDVYRVGEQYLWDELVAEANIQHVFLQAAFDAEERAFTPSLVSSSFENCGLWPFNEERILNLASLNLGVPKIEVSTITALAEAASAAALNKALDNSRKIV